MNKLLLLFSALCFISCFNKTKEEKQQAAIDSSLQATIATLTEREKQQSPYLQEIDNSTAIGTIEFQVKTTDLALFEDGRIPWASLENPEEDIKNMIDADKVVIAEEKVFILIDYPLNNPCKFELESKDGFTREQLLRAISKKYYEIYEEEEKTATVKTLPMEKRKIMNRNETNGTYGVWGHDIADLDLSEIYIYKTPKGATLLTLGVES